MKNRLFTVLIVFIVLFTTWTFGQSPEQFEKIVIDETGAGLLSSEVYSVNFDHHDNIFIMDTKDHCVKKFSTSGKYISSIGKKGKGPGEFITPLSMTVLSDRVYVLDTTFRLQSLTTKDAKFVKVYDKPIHDELFTYLHKYIMTDSLDDSDKDLFHLISSDLEYVKSFGNPEYFLEEVTSPFRTINTAYDSTGNIYAVYTKAGKIIVFDKDFKYSKTIPLKHPEFPVPEKNIPKFVSMEQYKKWQKKFILLRKIFTVSDKYIVISYERLFADKEYYIDVLTLDGEKIIYGKKFPYRLVGKDNKDVLYFYDYISNDDNVENVLYKYKITGGKEK